MQKFLFFVDRISRWFGKLFARCILILTLVVADEVFMRYVLGSQRGWAYDTSCILCGVLFMIAGAHAPSRNVLVSAHE